MRTLWNWIHLIDLFPQSLCYYSNNSRCCNSVWSMRCAMQLQRSMSLSNKSMRQFHLFAFGVCVYMYIHFAPMVKQKQRTRTFRQRMWQTGIASVRTRQLLEVMRNAAKKRIITLRKSTYFYQHSHNTAKYVTERLVRALHIVNASTSVMCILCVCVCLYAFPYKICIYSRKQIDPIWR